MANRPRSSRPDGERPRTTIKAAGGVVWRDTPDGREVLVVHRPKYDDWSLPKGKLEAGEPAVLAAVREIAEETGWRVRLGPELRTAKYKVDGIPKVVRYWLAHPVSSVPFEPNDEIDATAWIDASEAKQRLGPFDQALVRTVMPKARPAAPLLVVRHALSIRRKDWKGDDRDRPLSRDGSAQSIRIARLMEAWAPVRVVTSSSQRCRDTVAPYAKAAGIELELVEALTEEGFEHDAKPARSLIAELRDAVEPVVVCTHRPLLATIARSIDLDLPKNARSNPLPKGGMWVAHGSRDHEVERYTT